MKKISFHDFALVEYDPEEVYELEITWDEWLSLSRGRRNLFKQMRKQGDIKIHVGGDRPRQCIMKQINSM